MTMTQETYLNDAKPFLNLIALLRDHDVEISGMIATTYDRIAEEWNRKVARKALDQLFADTAARIPSGGRVLDAGCGTGLLAQDIYHALKPESLTAIDTSQAMLDKARERVADGKTFSMNGDILNLPFENETFDVVTATWVIETLDDPKRAMQECLRVLKNGGVLACSYVNIPKSFRPADQVDSSTLHQLDEITKDRERQASKRIAFNDGEFALVTHYHRGLISTVLIGKCCEVETHMLPVNNF